MSTHPNAILLLRLKPDGLTRATLRAIVAEHDGKNDENVKIGDDDFHIKAMEGDYDDGFQIAADEGDIIVFDMVTYGYGECIPWADLERKKRALEEWATGVCERHKCTQSIFVTANYW